MKKFLILFMVFVININYAFAISEEASNNIKALRTVKNAKTRALRKEITSHRKNIEQIMLNTKLNESQKAEQYKKEENTIQDLYSKINEMEHQYKKEKKAIKKKY